MLAPALDSNRGGLIWKGFASAPPASRKLIPAMFVLFLSGLVSIAIAPMVKQSKSNLHAEANCRRRQHQP